MVNLLKKLYYKIKIWWDFLWIRKDEFHKSLNYDPFAAVYMNKEEHNRYLQNLSKRRQTAHERDIINERVIGYAIEDSKKSGENHIVKVEIKT